MILVLRALGIGDLCAGVPALRGLRAHCPDETIALAAPAWLRPLVDLTGAVDRLVPVPDLTPRPWPPAVGRPRLAVNLHGRGPQSHQLLASADPETLLAFACPPIGFYSGPAWDATEHETHRWCRLLQWYRIPSTPDDLALGRPRPDLVPVGVTVVHPGAKAAERRWPAERFAAVAAALAAAGHTVVVTGSRAERPLAEAVARPAGLDPQAVLAGRTDVGQMAALVAYARLVVCGDTGVAHLATAFGTPSVLLFGPTPPAHWGPPPGRRQHRVIWHGSSLSTVDVAEVLAAAYAAAA